MNCVRKLTLVLLFLTVLLMPAVYAQEVLKLATTTSTYETGLLDVILPVFEEKYNVKVHVISVGTGKAIKIAENGDADVILVHARAAEDKFVQDGFGVNRRDVMYNDFIILGPKNDPAKIKGWGDAKEAFKRIAAGECAFISRGDNSGTHIKEGTIWSKIGKNPQGAWYLEAGQGMAATMRIADEKNAYVLVDRATYLFNKNKIRLVDLVEGDKDLFNPYGIIAVSPYRHAHVKYDLAMALIAWMTSPQCQQMIADFKVEGSQMYHPNAY